MFRLAHNDPLGDIVDDFCSAVGLSRGMCDFLRVAFDELGFDPSNIENELRTEGKDRICEQVADLVGADFPGGKTAAKRLCRELLDKIAAHIEGDAPATPRPPGRFTMTAVTTMRAEAVPRPKPPLLVATAISIGLPPGSIATQDVKANEVRVAVPKPPATGPGPKFVEVAARRSLASLPPDVLKVQFRDFLRKTGQLPLYKDPVFWAIAAGSVTALGSAIWIRRRRRG
jgi:hypothetical protein